MKKALLFVFFLFISSTLCYSQESSIQPKNLMLSGSVSEIPPAILGMWRVVSNLENTDSPLTFRKKSLDLWNLTQVGNVMKLCNPFSGAQAEITLISSSDKHLVFEKVKNYQGKIVTDTVELYLNGDYFEGNNRLKLETLSDVDGSIIKTENAQYKLKGEKISGGEI